ncbi:hypothetical protein FMEAI12_3280022 [Parafrankia sp. Ea1.12]|nr:hypothetical protein FMEAI12_3280022 [Parafrankia sp. Ea1.12]
MAYSKEEPDPCGVYSLYTKSGWRWGLRLVRRRPRRWRPATHQQTVYLLSYRMFLH